MHDFILTVKYSFVTTTARAETLFCAVVYIFVNQQARRGHAHHRLVAYCYQ